MKALINKLQRKFKEVNSQNIEGALIFDYVKNKHLNIEQSVVLKKFLDKYRKQNTQLEEYIERNLSISTIDDLIAAFELLIDENERKNNGMVYTPLNIKKYIIKKTIVSDKIPKVVDPACGCGSFLITAAKWMRERYKVS